MSWSIELAEDIEYSNFFGYSCPLAIFRPQREFSRFVSSRRTIFKKHYLIADQIFSYAKTRFSLTLHILSFIFTSAHIVEKWRDDESFPHWLLDDAGALETVNYIAPESSTFVQRKWQRAADRFVHSRKQGLFDYYWKNHWQLRRTNLKLDALTSPSFFSRIFASGKTLLVHFPLRLFFLSPADELSAIYTTFFTYAFDFWLLNDIFGGKKCRKIEHFENNLVLP